MRSYYFLFFKSLSSCLERKLQWFLCVGRWIITRLRGFLFQIFRCCLNSYPPPLLLVWILLSRGKQHRKASHPRTLQYDDGVGWIKDLDILVAIIIWTPLTTRPLSQHLPKLTILIKDTFIYGFDPFFSSLNATKMRCIILLTHKADFTYRKKMTTLVFAVPNICEQEQCLNGGTCVQTNVILGEYRCECPPGFTGFICDEEISE